MVTVDVWYSSDDIYGCDGDDDDNCDDDNCDDDNCDDDNCHDD
jgi:hypothetical protein